MPALQMRSSRLRGISAAVASLWLAGACGATSSPAPTGSATTATVATLPPSTAPTVLPSPTPLPPAFARNPAPIVDGVAYSQTIDATDFVAGVHHPFYPLQPGSRWVYEGAEHVEVTVLPETKLILGVAATVVRDRVFVDGKLAEDTLDWYAQDRDGNVWYFGEDTKAFKDDGTSLAMRKVMAMTPRT